MSTPSLFDALDDDVTPLEPASTVGSWTEQAAAFDAANPQVYRACVRVARYIKARGFKRYGIGAIFEVLRFKAIETIGDRYRLNNNYRAWFAREIMRREEDLAGFFETRDVAHDPAYHDRETR